MEDKYNGQCSHGTPVGKYCLSCDVNGLAATQPDYRQLYEEAKSIAKDRCEAADKLRQTLRDQFAMAALMGLCAGRQERVSQFAAEAYNVADAMMKAREEG